MLSHAALRVLINALALLGVTYLIPGFAVDSYYTAIIVALVLGVVNIFFKPIIVILTLPINILTLGLFTFVINALLLWMVARWVEGFNIESFMPALVGALIYSAFSYFGHKIVVDSLTDYED